MDTLIYESIAILIILAVAGYIFLRYGRKDWGACVLPLMVVPFVNILIAHRSLTRVPHWAVLRPAAYAIAFLIASAWMVLWARRLSGGKSKVAYCASSIGFTLILVLLMYFKGPYFR